MDRRSPRHSPRYSTPPKVRYEPATIQEAVHAARDLTSDLEQQIEIAAGLIGLGHDEVRDEVLRQLQAAVASSRSVGNRTRRVVMVERRTPRPVSAGRPSSV